MEQKVKALENVPKIKLVGRKIGPYKEGEEAHLRPWEVSILEEEGLVEPVDDFSLTGLRKIVMREEKNKSLNDIPSCFYRAVSSKIRKMEQEGRNENAKKMRDSVDSLISLRIRKLLRMAVSSMVPEDIPPEEAFLVNRVSEDLGTWKQRLECMFEENSYEEVNDHEGKIGNSI